MFPLGLCFLLIFASSEAINYPCPSPTTRDTTVIPNAPIFPTESLDNAVTVGGFITEHWSEVAVMLRPNITTPVSNPVQTGCPHLAQGLSEWHNPSTWANNVVPVSGDVTIPTGKRVLLSSCSVDPSTVFGLIAIPPGSALIFADADIAIRAKGFRVDGELLLGAPGCRLRSKINITLHGARSDQALPVVDLNVKGIYVMGKIDVHGVQYAPTWTRLATTASPGDSIIYIQDLVNWQPGQTIVITTTEFKDARDWHRNEEKIIKAVYRVPNFPTLAAVELTTPIAYKHYGGSEYQAEVALLSRNIVIQGDENNSEPTDKYPMICNDTAAPKSTAPCANSSLTGFGAHVMVTGSTAIGRFEGVEFYRVGQTNQLGRYPVHFHVMGNVSGPDQASATDCSIHRSYFRCITIHATNNSLLSQNTAYDAIGHCYFVESGVEENNTLEFNFGALVHPIGPFAEISQGINGQGWGGQTAAWYNENENLVHPSDLAAGVFYFTNANNKIYGNAASGGWAGFSFPNLPKPIKDQRLVNTVPKDRPLMLFKSNTAHSTGYWWNSAAAIYVGGNLREIAGDPNGLTQYTHGREVSRNTRDNTGKQIWMRFEDAKVFLANRGIQNWGDREEVFRFEGHDLGLSANVFGNVWIDDMLMNCRSNNTITWFNGCIKNQSTVPWGILNTRDFQFHRGAVGFQFYDTGMRHIITNSKFRNCNIAAFPQCVQCSFASWELLTHSDQFVPDHMQTTRNIAYENCDMKNLIRFTVQLSSWDAISGRLQSWEDKDGSAGNLVKTGQRLMLGSNRSAEWYKLNTGCTLVNEMWQCAMNTGDGVVSMMANYDAVTQAKVGNGMCGNGDKSVCPVIGSITHFGRNKGSGLKLGGNPRISGPMISESGGWFIEFSNQTLGTGTPANLALSSFQIDIGVPYVIVAIPYPTGTTFTIKAYAASWCSTSWGTCTTNFTAVNSTTELKNSGGDKYYWDSTAGILYLRIITLVDYGNFKPLGVPWNLSTINVNSIAQFNRSNITLISQSCCGMNISIIANCGQGTDLYCPYVDRAVPAAIGCNDCYKGPAPISDWNCVVNDWSDWGICSLPCGGGTQTRSRRVTQKQVGQGSACPNLKESQSCNTDPCPVTPTPTPTPDPEPQPQQSPQQQQQPGQQQPQQQSPQQPQNNNNNNNCVPGNWSNWGNCSVSCGVGIKVRTREEVVPATGDGLPCTLSESASCVAPCPLYVTWTQKFQNSSSGELPPISILENWINSLIPPLDASISVAIVPIGNEGFSVNVTINGPDAAAFMKVLISTISQESTREPLESATQSTIDPSSVLSSPDSVASAPSSEIPFWVWIVVGGVALIVIVAVIIALVVKARKNPWREFV